jgi:hypothetical protein
MTRSSTETLLSRSSMTEVRGPVLKLSLGQRLLLVAAGYVPFVNIVVIGTLVIIPASANWSRWTWCLAPAWLLIIPPIVVRLLLAIRPLPETDIPIGSQPFLRWWFTSQWQVIFNRLPWIEEIIRLVPGLYAVWLRLWGAKVGELVYWTPGFRILDRSLLNVGDRVVYGVGVKIAPHIIMRDRDGQLVLRVATVRIGDEALVGAYSLLLAGSWIGPGEASPGKLELAPFTGWVDGRRVHSKDEALKTNV